jgi:hypothetical protein
VLRSVSCITIRVCIPLLLLHWHCSRAAQLLWQPLRCCFSPVSVRVCITVSQFLWQLLRCDCSIWQLLSCCGSRTAAAALSGNCSNCSAAVAAAPLLLLQLATAQLLRCCGSCSGSAQQLLTRPLLCCYALSECRFTLHSAWTRLPFYSVLCSLFIICIKCLSENTASLIHFTIGGGYGSIRPLPLVEVNQAILAWSYQQES